MGNLCDQEAVKWSTSHDNNGITVINLKQLGQACVGSTTGIQDWPAQQNYYANLMSCYFNYEGTKWLLQYKPTLVYSQKLQLFFSFND